MPDETVLRARLDEAEAALHALAIGAREASIAVAGHSISYTAADMNRLRAYIDDLRSQLGERSGRGAVSVRFGGPV